MSLKIINPSIWKNATQYSNEFGTNKPFKHIVLNDFFEPDFAEQLLKDFPQFDEEKATNENGTVGRKAVHENVSGLGQAYQALDELVQTEDFLGWVSRITGIKNLKYDPYYFGGGTHNNLHGQDLDPHVDFTHHPISGDHRRLNLIIYLNKEWHKEWGGNIEFHKNPRLEPELDEIVSVEPVFNRAVIFETNNISWHGFPRIDLPSSHQGISRKSFALYFYTDYRDENIAPHSTIYVERHLPDSYQPNMILSEENLHEIRTLLTRRDQHLERLYNNITHLMTEVRDLKYLQGLQTEKHTKEMDAFTQKLANGQNPIEMNLRKRIFELENSTSWKVTRPIRKMVRWLKK